jgi:hypothetical protein
MNEATTSQSASEFQTQEVFIGDKWLLVTTAEITAMPISRSVLAAAAGYGHKNS